MIDKNIAIIHADPADRLIIAYARILDTPLITFDKEILKYAKKGYVKYY
jgi:PIN domain nuclease of toxin-antitoxin system